MQLDLGTAPEEDFDVTNPRQPLTLVCVDGSEESDRALRWAMRNLPDTHGLMLIHGVKIPYRVSLEIHPHKAEDMREHDRLVQRYRRICQENGRRCGMAHFLYQRGDAFGDGVCSYARLRGAQAVVTGRRTNISNARRAVFGSGSQYVLQHCEDIPVTVVSTEEQSD